MPQTMIQPEVKEWLKSNLHRLGYFRPSDAAFLMRAEGLPVSDGQVGRAIRSLAAEGVVYRPAQRGTYTKAPAQTVAPTTPDPASAEEAQRKIIREEVLACLAAVGLTPEVQA